MLMRVCGPETGHRHYQNTLREAILDGKIGNEYAEAYQLMLDEGAKIGLKPVLPQEPSFQ